MLAITGSRVLCLAVERTILKLVVHRLLTQGEIRWSMRRHRLGRPPFPPPGNVSSLSFSLFLFFSLALRQTFGRLARLPVHHLNEYE